MKRARGGGRRVVTEGSRLTVVQEYPPIAVDLAEVVAIESSSSPVPGGFHEQVTIVLRGGGSVVVRGTVHGYPRLKRLMIRKGGSDGA